MIHLTLHEQTVLNNQDDGVQTETLNGHQICKRGRMLTLVVGFRVNYNHPPPSYQHTG